MSASSSAYSALLRRAGRHAFAPAGVALVAGGGATTATSSYLGRRGSADVAARTASSAAAVALQRCRFSSSSSAPGGVGVGVGGVVGAVRAPASSIWRRGQQALRHHQRRTLSTTTTTTAAAASDASSKAAKVTSPPTAKPAAGAAAEAAEAKSSGGGKGGGGGGGFLAWYESHLQSRPVPTKMVTGGILWGLGDVVAQVVPVVTHPDDDTAARDFQFDAARLARASTFGFVVHAPIAHLHYNFLEWMTVRSGITGGVKVPVFKAFMEQFVYWSWFSNSLYHGTMGAMQGWSARQCYDRVADVLWDTQKAQWAFWIPVQLVNFRYVPVRHQLNVVLLTSVAWTALLSAWYPPERTEETERKELIK